MNHLFMACKQFKKRSTFGILLFCTAINCHDNFFLRLWFSFLLNTFHKDYQQNKISKVNKINKPTKKKRSLRMEKEVPPK